MSIREELLHRLADGEVHSGADLAAELDRSRTAVWKQLQRLRSLGLELQSLPGRGYRLARPLDLFDADTILDQLPAEQRTALESLEVARVLESTSDRLRAGEPPAPGRFRAALAEYQTGGRGRRGRRWLSPFATGLCLSVNWHFQTAPPGLTALGLAVGVMVHEALTETGAQGLLLKWPNDVVVASGKVAGLLVDMDGEANGPVTVVVGVGVNVDVSEELQRQLAAEAGPPPAALRAVVPGGRVSRNTLAAVLLGALGRGLALFQQTGFSAFADTWRRFDCLYGQPVTVQVGTQTHRGTARGIGADGALLLDVAGEIKTVVSGDVTLRAAP